VDLEFGPETGPIRSRRIFEALILQTYINEGGDVTNAFDAGTIKPREKSDISGVTQKTHPIV